MTGGFGGARASWRWRMHQNPSGLFWRTGQVLETQSNGGPPLSELPHVRVCEDR